MKLNPLYHSEGIIFIGLDEDQREENFDDCLVVKLNLIDKKITAPPWSLQKHLKHGDCYEAVDEKDQPIFMKVIQNKISDEMLMEIENMLISPSQKSIESLIWVSERLKKIKETRMNQIILETKEEIKSLPEKMLNNPCMEAIETLITASERLNKIQESKTKQNILEPQVEIRIEAEKIPYEVFENTEITQLEVLIEEFDLGSCEALKPSYLKCLTKLKKLSLAGIHITEDIFKNEICGLTELEELDLMYAQIQSLPSEITQLKKLKFICFRANRLTEIPHFLSKLEYLEKLNFIDNRIVFIPESLTKLTKLKELDLRDNPLEPKYSELRSDLGMIDLKKFKETLGPNSD